MNIITQYELDQLLMVQNQTMVTCDWFNKHVFIDGVQLCIDDSYEPLKHVVTYGTVVKPPPSIIKLEEVPIEEGDTVWFHHNTIGHCENDKRVFMVEGTEGDVKIYYIIPYQYFFCYRKVDGEIFTINDGTNTPLLLLEAIPEAVVVDGGIESNHERALSGEYKNTEAIVAYTPKGYDKLNKGDVVAFGNGADVPLQYSLHSNLDSNKMFFRVREPDIFFRVEE